MGIGIGSGVITGGFYHVLNLLLDIVLLIKLFAFVDAAIRPNAAYTAAEKLTKGGWLIILGLAVALDVFLGGLMSIFTIAGMVAAIVYLVDVRPAVRQLSGRGRRTGSSSDGPYGPW
jgi:hypothetical protein